jgi:hypothetical protein
MANDLSNIKVSGTSTEKTNLTSTLKAEDAGFEFTIVGGSTYRWNGSAFNESLTSGADRVHINNSDVANDSALFLDTEGVTALAASGTATSGDVSAYSHGVFIVSGTGTLTLTGSPDGTNFTTSVHVYNFATVPKAAIAATALAAGSYYIENMAFKNLKFTEAGGAATVTVVMALKA